MKERIDFKIDLPQDVIKIHTVFKEQGFELYLVGGCVRDSYLGIKPKDWDLVTNAIPDKIIEILKGQSFVTNILETGKAFGVINAITKNDEFEIATFRSDGDYTDSRRPDSVEFSTIDKDCLRRDLSINALYYDIEKSQIIDLVDGIYDLQFGEIKTVGNPVDRFNEDKLRKLRAIRFTSRLGFMLNSTTASAIARDNNLIGVSPERIRDEFIKGVTTAKSVSKFLYSLFSFDMFSIIFPGLVIYPSDFVFERNPNILMATLFNRNNPKVVEKVLSELKYSKDEVNQVCFFMELLNFEPKSVFNAKKRQILYGIDGFDIIRFAELNDLDIVLIDRFVDFKLTVTGADVEKLGIKPGPEMGRKIQEMELENFIKFLHG